jgi:hypothetical protein
MRKVHQCAIHPAHYQHPPQSGTFITTDDPISTHPYHPSSTLYIWVHSVLYFLWSFDKHMMTCIHHYSIIQSILTALKILCPAYQSLPSPNLWLPLILLLSLTLFAFPKCQILGIIQCVIFSYWLLSLSIYASSIFWQLVSSILLVLNIFHCLKVPHFIYPFTYWRIS